MTETIRYCYIHHSTYLTNQAHRCLWDTTIGPRPGRGPCQPTQATITYSTQTTTHSPQPNPVNPNSVANPQQATPTT